MTNFKIPISKFTEKNINRRENGETRDKNVTTEDTESAEGRKKKLTNNQQLTTNNYIVTTDLHRWTQIKNH